VESDDHVTVVLRRQRLLAPLEGEPFVPVQEAPAEEPPAPVAAKAAPVREEAVEVSDAAPEPMHSVPDLADESASDDDGERELATASAGTDGSEGLAMLGGAHVPQDVVPPRPEPFLPRRQADFDEQAGTPVARPVHVQAGPSASMGGLGDVVGATATSPDPDSVSVIERDPNVNRSLMLRLIAGVRGL
jgi:hypothetical protein